MVLLNQGHSILGSEGVRKLLGLSWGPLSPERKEHRGMLGIISLGRKDEVMIVSALSALVISLLALGHKKVDSATYNLPWGPIPEYVGLHDWKVFKAHRSCLWTRCCSCSQSGCLGAACVCCGAAFPTTRSMGRKSVLKSPPNTSNWLSEHSSSN